MQSDLYMGFDLDLVKSVHLTFGYLTLFVEKGIHVYMRRPTNNPNSFSIYVELTTLQPNFPIIHKTCNMNNPIIRLNQPGLKGREGGITIYIYTPRRRSGETQSIHFSDIIFLKVPFLDVIYSP